MEICVPLGRYLLTYSNCSIKLIRRNKMVSENKVEDYQTSLTEEQKNILDDAPAKVVTHLFDYVERNGHMEFFNLTVRDKLTGAERFARYEGPDAVNGIDYLRFLVRNGYKDLADAG